MAGYGIGGRCPRAACRARAAAPRPAALPRGRRRSRRRSGQPVCHTVLGGDERRGRRRHQDDHRGQLVRRLRRVLGAAAQHVAARRRIRPRAAQDRPTGSRRNWKAGGDAEVAAAATQTPRTGPDARSRSPAAAGRRRSRLRPTAGGRCQAVLADHPADAAAERRPPTPTVAASPDEVASPCCWRAAAYSPQVRPGLHPCDAPLRRRCSTPASRERSITMPSSTSSGRRCCARRCGRPAAGRGRGRTPPRGSRRRRRPRANQRGWQVDVQFVNTTRGIIVIVRGSDELAEQVGLKIQDGSLADRVLKKHGRRMSPRMPRRAWAARWLVCSTPGGLSTRPGGQAVRLAGCLAGVGGSATSRSRRFRRTGRRAGPEPSAAPAAMSTEGGVMRSRAQQDDDARHRDGDRQPIEVRAARQHQAACQHQSHGQRTKTGLQALSPERQARVGETPRHDQRQYRRRPAHRDKAPPRRTAGRPAKPMRLTTRTSDRARRASV